MSSPTKSHEYAPADTDVARERMPNAIDCSASAARSQGRADAPSLNTTTHADMPWQYSPYLPQATTLLGTLHHQASGPTRQTSRHQHVSRRPQSTGHDISLLALPVHYDQSTQFRLTLSDFSVAATAVPVDDPPLYGSP